MSNATHTRYMPATRFMPATPAWPPSRSAEISPPFIGPPVAVIAAAAPVQHASPSATAPATATNQLVPGRPSSPVKVSTASHNKRASMHEIRTETVGGILLSRRANPRSGGWGAHAVGYPHKGWARPDTQIRRNSSPAIWRSHPGHHQPSRTRRKGTRGSARRGTATSWCLAPASPGALRPPHQQEPVGGVQNGGACLRGRSFRKNATPQVYPERRKPTAPRHWPPL